MAPNTNIVAIVAAMTAIAFAAPLGGRGATQSGAQLYFLAGTITFNSGSAYPVTLYRLGDNKNLVPVRALVGASDGAASILRDARGTVYVLYPHDMPTSLSILHPDSLKVPDEVSFNNNNAFVLNTVSAVSEENDQVSYYNMPVNVGNQLKNGLTLVSVRGKNEGDLARITANEWFRYQKIYVEGETGGGGFSPELTGRIQGSLIAIPIGMRRVVLFGTLPQHAESWAGRQVSIVAANDKYLIFSLTRTQQELEAGSSSRRLLYVYDKLQGRWRELSMPSDSPRVRILGPWLTSISEFYSPKNQDNPGRENERATDTPLLPNVRDEYAQYLGSQYRIPGVLTLDNLEDGRKMTIGTEQEDSEIIGVLNGNEVFYRVNDSVFQRTIVGNRLGDRQLVVQGDDVPEIHWMFVGPPQ